MATALTLLNNVLRGLRRNVVTATSTTNSYEMMLIQFLNLAKDRIEEQWDWHALRNTVTVTVSQGTVAYELSASGPADIDVGDRSRLLYEKRVVVGGSDTFLESSDRALGSLPQVFDTTDSTEYRLDEVSPEEIERLHLTDNDEQNQPTHFALYRASGFVYMKIWPTPSGARTIKMRFVIPQAEIPSTAMTSYTLSIPDRPVWLRALTMAYEERGEEAGRPLASVAREADDALFLALDREMTAADLTGQPI